MSLVARNAAWNFAGQLALLLIGFIATRFVFRDLGGDAVGVLYFAFTLGAVLSGVLELGIGTTVVREVAARHADREYVQRLLGTAAFLHWGGYVASVLLIWGSAPLIAQRWLNLSSLDEYTVARSLQVLGLGVVTALPRALYASVCRGLQRSEVPNMIEVSTALAQQLGIIVIVRRGGSLPLVSFWYSGCFAAALVAYAGYVGHWFGSRALVPIFASDIVRAQRRYAGSVFAISALSMLNTQTDKLAISRLLPLGALGLYNVTYGFAARSLMIPGAISQALLPSLAALAERREWGVLSDQFLRMQRFIIVATAPLVAVMIFATPWILSLVFDTRTAAELELVSALLGCGFYLNGCLTMPHVLALASGHPEIVARGNLLAALVTLPITVMLTNAAGLAGAAFGWVLYHVLMYTYVVPRVCRRVDDGLLSRWLTDWSRFAVPALLLYGSSIALTLHLRPSVSARVLLFVAAMLLTTWFARRALHELWSMRLRMPVRTLR